MRQASLLALAFLGLAANTALARDEAPAAAKGAPYMGVLIASLPEAAVARLSGIVPRGEGVVVTRVFEGSPADRAGLLSGDILLTYGGDKLASAQQLAQLVARDRPGRGVHLTVVRGGKIEPCDVVLGETLPSAGAPGDRIDMLRELVRTSDNQTWKSFDAIKLTRLGGGRWCADVDYSDNQGLPKHRTLEGTPDEISDRLGAQADLPGDALRHLMRAVYLRESEFHFSYPPMEMSPSLRER